jgi:hypothetical protein
LKEAFMAGLFVLWALDGWCGTPYPGWLLYWLLHHGPPPPPPDGYQWLISKGIGVVGGIVGGLAFHQAFSSGQDVTALVAATSSVGAFVGSILFNDAAGFLMKGQRATGKQKR